MKFENPYNFIPAFPRDTAHAGLGDAAPGKDFGHDKYRKDRWSGRICVKLTTVTPLLIPELMNEDSKGHKTFGVRKDETGSPYLSPTSIKGVLRSAYEAATNSRMGVFSTANEELSSKVSSQKLYAKDLLDESLKLAVDFRQLSPADRVFGWVGQNGKGSYRGAIRITGSRCASGPGAIERLSNGKIMLAVLGKPQPKYGPFYSAKDSLGGAYEIGTSKKNMYKQGASLRGRKAYLTSKQATSPEYWNLDKSKEAYTQVVAVDKSGKKFVREWISPAMSSSNDNVSVSIAEWVKIGTEFYFDLKLNDLSGVELGALLWLLKDRDRYGYKFGYGKPLGFGCVSISLEHVELRSGEGIREHYRSFCNVTDPTSFICGTSEQVGKRLSDLISEYERSRASSFSKNIEPTKKSKLDSYLRTAFDNVGKMRVLSVHYPRTRAEPKESKQIAEWFGDNERGISQSLPAAWQQSSDDCVLLYNVYSKKRSNR